MKYDDPDAYFKHGREAVEQVLEALRLARAEKVLKATGQRASVDLPFRGTVHRDASLRLARHVCCEEMASSRRAGFGVTLGFVALL
jgi:hypothetical protein